MEGNGDMEGPKPVHGRPSGADWGRVANRGRGASMLDSIRSASRCRSLAAATPNPLPLLGPLHQSYRARVAAAKPSCRIQAPTHATVCRQTIEIAVTGRPLLARRSTRHPAFQLPPKVSLPACASVVSPPQKSPFTIIRSSKRHTQAMPGAFHRSLSQKGKTPPPTMAQTISHIRPP